MTTASAPDITDSEFGLFCSLLEESIGLHLRVREKRLVASRLRTRILELGCSSYFEYYRLVTEGPGSHIELGQLVDALTTNKTDFFRHLGQLEHFRDEIVPDLVRRMRSGEIDSVRIWSAGCSTGEEAYSLAILLMESVPFGLFHNFSIVASDVSTAALAAAEEGVYLQRRFEGVDPGVLDRYFDVVRPGEYRIKDRARRLVAFQKHNLNSPIWSVGLFDVIFCRNVLIYFDLARVRAILSRFHQRLKSDGILYLGQTESLPEEDGNFCRVAPCTYRRGDRRIIELSTD